MPEARSLPGPASSPKPLSLPKPVSLPKALSLPETLSGIAIPSPTPPANMIGDRLLPEGGPPQ
jgi:hypothetical protein